MRLKVFSADAEKWQDVARRIRRAELVDVGDSVRMDSGPPSDVPLFDIALFDGAAEAEPRAVAKVLESGKHVLVVGPPCLSAEALANLVARAARAKLRFACVNPDRLLPSRAMIKSRLGAALGSPELVRIHVRRAHVSADMSAPLGLPGELVGEIEQAMWLIGRPLVRVFAAEPRIDGDDAAGRPVLAHLSFDSGMATVDYDDRLPAGNHAAAASYRFLSVIGSSGSAQIDDHRNSQLLYFGGAPRALAVDEGVRHLATLVDDFAAAVKGEADFPDGVAAWTEAARAVEAVLRSLKSRDVANLEVA
jgi:predicted dehydrogenase